METTHRDHEKLGNILKVISRPDALRILLLADQGIRSSTHAIEELGMSKKSYYARMKALMEEGLVIKSGSIYRQTALGNILCNRFLPAMGRACDSKDKLEIINRLEGTEFADKVKRVFEDELDILGFTESSNMRMIGDYESMVVDVVDICTAAEESMLMASNYLDVRVMDTTFRNMDSGVKTRFICGREVLSSRLSQLRLLFSPKVTKSMLKLASKSTDVSEFARIIDLPYSFCVVDGHINMIEISDASNASFIAAFSVKDRGIGKRLTDSFEKLWNAGERQSTLKFLSAFKS